MKYKLPILMMILLLSIEIIAQNWSPLITQNECTHRHENSLAAVKDHIYLVGGRKIKPVEVLNVKQKTWTKKIETPIEMHHFQAITFKNEIWVLGAFTGPYPHETPIKHIWIYSPNKNEWRKGPDIPAERLRGSAGAFVYNNKIYLICGIQDGHWDGHVSWFDVFDPKTNVWHQLPDAPRPRDHAQAVVIDNILYLAGGRISSGKIKKVFELTVNEVDLFDFKTSKWMTLSENLNLPTPRAGTSAVEYNKRLLIIGGESSKQNTAHHEVEAFDINKMEWQKLSALNTGRHGTSAVKVKNKVYIISGSGNRGGSPELNSIEVLE
jgi:N-acetylneuraminic acid mutarotase